MSVGRAMRPLHLKVGGMLDLVMIDYGAGNVQSVQYALERLGHRAEITADPDRVARAEKVIFPGVGAARASMDALRERGLDAVIPLLQQPVLGVCVGLQVMAAHSEEDDTPCLGIVPGWVRKFGADATHKVPQMGWNTLHNVGDWLPANVEDAYVYYVHSYALELGPWTVATTDYTVPFTAALRHKNFYGTQFHVEKSGSVGAGILAAFLAL